MKIMPLVVLTLSFAVVVESEAAYNYGEALQKAIYFYECQKSGPSPAWNRVQWRGPCDTHDGSDVGVNLSGGWHDAGDHVKFNFPMSYSVTMLCWGIVENRAAYVNSGQLVYLLNNIRWATDYLIRCHTAPNVFYGQVGDAGVDHSYWGPAESDESEMPQRPSARIDSANPGSDLAGEAAAALAAASIVFKPTDAAYSDTCLTHARQLYAFADKYRGIYSNSIPRASGYYSSSGYHDELVWGATWLFMASGDSSYLAKAETYYDSLADAPQSTTKNYQWTLCWDDKSYGCYVLLSKLTGSPVYEADAQRWLDYWTIGVNGQEITYTPGGLAWLSIWGSCRYAATTAFCALVYGDFIADTALKSRYHNFAVNQINYMLGNNPLNRSLVVGFGVNPPRHEHHRTADGLYPGQAADTQACIHTMYGALVGGPDQSDNYTDQRSNYTQNEPACDYNAGFASALARLYKEYGGAPLTQFPPKDSVTEQFHILAKVNASGTLFTEIDAILCNMTNEPARVCRTLSYRYFVDLSEAIAAGISVNDITVSTNYLQGNAKISALTPYNGSSSIYYLEVSYYNDSLFPSTQDSYKREAQFRISLPQNAAASSWDPSNDWSYKTVGMSSPDTAVNMPIYDNEVQIWGAEPGKAPITSIKALSLSNKQNSFIKVTVSGKNIYVAMTRDKSAELSIVNIDGKLLYKTHFKGSYSMDARKLSRGAYFAIVKTDQGTFISKVINVR
jgi:hypothetical protein